MQADPAVARELNRSSRNPNGKGNGNPLMHTAIDWTQARSGRVSVVIPALNEADSIGWVLSRIPEWVSEVVLVDGLSVDQTELVARQLRPDLVVVHQRNAGKGSALRAGFAAASSDYVVMLDADGSTDPAEMGRFIEALEAGADFVKGSRYLKGGGSSDLTRIRGAGNRALAQMVNLMYGSHFTDLCYGYCAFHRRHLDALALTASGFEIETQLALNAVRAGLEIREVPSFELPRRAGVSNLNAYRDGRRVLKQVLAARKITPPDRAAEPASISLLPMQVSHGPYARHPERRRRDRRLDRAGSYAGPERRRSERRRHPVTSHPPPRDPALVYMALEA
jgi:Glycosyl transferase family 2